MIYCMNNRNERKATWLIILFTVILAASAIGSVSGQSKLRQKQERLLDALIKVESNGNDKAIGDNGKAIGCLQIWKIYWQDAAVPGRNYSECLRDKDLSEQVVQRYMERYARSSLRRLQAGVGTLSDVARVARIHNGGPAGDRKQATVRYWNKVRSILGDER